MNLFIKAGFHIIARDRWIAGITRAWIAHDRRDRTFSILETIQTKGQQNILKYIANQK